MIEIKTITSDSAADFDRQVNEALTEGWELVKRDCFGFDHIPLYYAELERVIDDQEDDFEEIEDDVARWLISRNPKNPYKCSHCGYTTDQPWGACPKCKKIMLEPVE